MSRPKEKEFVSKTTAGYMILAESKKPMHVHEICEIAIKRGLIKTKGKTPASTLAADLLLENRRRESTGKKTRFVKVGSGTWALAEWKRR